MAIDVEMLPLDNYAVYQLILKETNGNVSEFANRIGIAQQRINRLFSVDARSGKYPRVSESIMETICDFYSISHDDLIKPYTYKYRNNEEVDPMKDLFGDKEPTMPFNEILKKYSHPSVEETADKVCEDSPIYGKGKPFYDVPFELGYKMPYNENYNNPDGFIYFDQYNTCDFWCRAMGQSMTPTIASGDIVALKEIKDFRYLVNNEVYAIVLKNELRTIKRVKDKGEAFLLIPDNRDYEEQLIPKDEILAVYKVMGAMKMF